ncbi:hypothetical protein EOI86_11630 [Hwanghaeella grinnelliae]|uniref:DUF4381 domain-containing protein n=1 Tax=Hwanghaeella grinnelliae TaxID=2500179 RepID=A0A3S2WR52_9PROT|nr:hypothetical protein [Hwanghaeella grinnelliae]RVU35900.1 hypothetical protein EOI86_11630 [Hwanghaeella grinnelliae]
MQTPSDIVSKLHPPRLPAGFADLTWQDGCAAFGVGLALGIVLYLLLRPFLARRLTKREQVAQNLDSFRALPASDRLVRQVRLWSELRRSAAEEQDTEPAWRQDLYRPDADIDLEALDAEILRLAAERGG